MVQVLNEKKMKIEFDRKRNAKHRLTDKHNDIIRKE
jgi:hypothetical protein